MASSSTSSIQKSFTYDVFLSFKGEDTRKTFIDHLHQALKQRNIITFKDDEKIEKGEQINDELIRSIEDSRFYIIVFSKNYASSSWCLDELLKIMECQKMVEHTAFPVFYDVEPTEIRNQIGSVREAFAKYEKEEAAGKWRDALKEAANLAGWELKNIFDGHEAKLIQDIVEKISVEIFCTNLSVDKSLVGMEHRVKDVVSSLGIGIDDVRMIGIWGIGGGGKTTLARVVFDQISILFEGSSFVENVREVSNDSFKGLKSLQKQLLSDVFNGETIRVSGVSDGKNKMKKMMSGRKVLVVLDDVDHMDQLGALAGEHNWYKPGSRIIITSRDKQVLASHGVNMIHDVNLLSDKEAICLFSRYAFRKEIPIQGFQVLSKKVVHYAAGLPLTVKVLGSFLFGKSDDEWIDALERLKTIPSKETLKVLEISYIGLENDYQEIFLDVACILKGWWKHRAVKALESCGFHAKTGLKVLEQKSLITISEYGYLGMHDRIEEMGMNIVRRLHPDEPWKHSRLWIKEEIEYILSKDLDMEATRCIKLHNWKLDPDTVMKSLRKMKKLRLLHVDWDPSKNWKPYESIHYLPNGLQSLHWCHYPFTYLPKTFHADNLVDLDMRFSNISQLWEAGERKVLNRIKFIDLSYSKLRTLDLELIPNLETLILNQCVDLEELDMRCGCEKLKSLVLSYTKLSTLKLGPTPNLETLNLEQCNDLVELHFPGERLKLKSLDLSYSKLRALELGPTPNLEKLHLKECKELVELHMPTGEMPKLKSLNLSYSKLNAIKLGPTPNLKTLNLEECEDLKELRLLGERPELKSLSLFYCKLRALDLGITPNLEELYLKECEELVELHMPDEMPKLKSVNLSCSKLRALYLRVTPYLEELNLEQCRNLVELHMPNEMPKLKSLNLYNSKLCALKLGPTPNLEVLHLEQCQDLVELHMPNEMPKLKSLNLYNSKLCALKLGPTPNLEVLHLEQCQDFIELHMPDEMPKLKSLNLNNSKLSALKLGPTPNLEALHLKKCEELVELHMPVGSVKLKSFELFKSKLRILDISQTLSLVTLDLHFCDHLVELHVSIELTTLRLCSLPKLRTLDLAGTLDLETLKLEYCDNLVDLHMHDPCVKLKNLHLNGLMLRTLDLGLTPNLEELYLKDCCNLVELQAPVGCLRNLESFSGNICGLRYLRKLTLKGSIPEVPKDLHQLECLEELSLSCTEIKLFSNSICMLKHLKVLKLESCWHLELLPEVRGRFECFPNSISMLKHLKVLNLESCWLFGQLPEDRGRLECFPNSICMLKHENDLKLESFWLFEQLPDDLGRLEFLEELSLSSTRIRHLPNSIFMLKLLKVLKLESCWLLEQLPEDIGRLECLEELILSSAKIEHLPNSICMLKHLKVLKVKSCWLLEQLPEDLGRLECLRELELRECILLRDIPNSICEMNRLRYFRLPYCILVEKLPEEIGRLRWLKELDIEGTVISHLPQSLYRLKRLRIYGSRWRLMSYGFTSVKESSTYRACCYIWPKTYYSKSTNVTGLNPSTSKRMRFSFGLPPG